MGGARWAAFAALVLSLVILDPYGARGETATVGAAALSERCNQGGGEGIDNDDVIGACTEILGSNPSAFETANAHVHRGLSYHGKQQDVLAEQDFSAALAVLSQFHLTAPDDLAAWREMTGQTWFNRCVARTGLKRYQGALTDCGQALALLSGNPNSVKYVTQAHEFRGNAYYELGNYDLSLADFETAQQLSPNDVGALVGLGRVEKTLGQLRHEPALIASSERHIAQARALGQSQQ
jgi:tetratricopeptide (TPR) repeat protein